MNSSANCWSAEYSGTAVAMEAMKAFLSDMYILPIVSRGGQAPALRYRRKQHDHLPCPHLIKEGKFSRSHIHARHAQAAADEPRVLPERRPHAQAVPHTRSEE